MKLYRLISIIVQKECWKIYRNENNDPEINHYHRMRALNLLRKSNETKFNMFTNVPGFMEIEKLRTAINDIKSKTFDKKGNFIRHLTEEELDNLHKP